MTENEILKKAKKLGNAIGESKEWKQFRKASKLFKENDELQKMLKALKEKEQKQEEKLKKGQPVEVEEKQEIKRLEDEISKNEVFKAFVNAENNYLILMGKIDKAIKEGTEEAEKN
ncbi:MAG: hypothetical protein B5M53_08520 [Candidatus Cloacimonas sp. 4484_209]|nr:MAG: hypothetical protein B5M53_08520 [Candidatus Cloacimonas sp. 4484_209]